MNAVRNYQRELDRIIEERGADAPTLLLHSCCAPCSSYVMEYLRGYFRLTVFYYNPNISPDEEYRKRVAEEKRLIAAYNAQAVSEDGVSRQTAEDGAPEGGTVGYPIEIIEGEYEPEHFAEIARGREDCPEGGERCFACYELRLRETAARAAEGGFDYFATTLTVSPLKNAAKLNEIGERLAAEYGTAWLPSDFKKKGGYKRSVELSGEYGLYRQDYCGCAYSKAERERRKRERAGSGAV